MALKFASACLVLFCIGLVFHKPVNGAASTPIQCLGKKEDVVLVVKSDAIEYPTAPTTTGEKNKYQCGENVKKFSTRLTGKLPFFAAVFKQH